LAVVSQVLLAAVLHLGDDGEAVIRGGLREGWPVPTLLQVEVALLRDRHRGGLGPILRGGGLRHDAVLSPDEGKLEIPVSPFSTLQGLRDKTRTSPPKN